MIVDCHTHWSQCFKDRDGLDPANWLAVLQKYGVTHAVVLPFTGLLHAGRIQQDNDDIATIAKASGGRLLPFCTLNTWFRDQALSELHRCLGELKFRGIKFHPWIQGQSVTTPVMDEICEVAADHNAPILFHDGTPPFSLPSQMAILAKRHPRTTIILGHCGMLEHWREAVLALNSTENLWGCLCSPHPAAIRELVGRCDGNRLLWGSDYGFSFTDMVGYRMEMIAAAGVSTSLQHKFFDENPRRLFQLSEVGVDETAK